MTEYFVDPNRGDDAKSGIGQANAVKTLVRLSELNPNPGGGGGIYLASDGIHTLTGSRVVSKKVGLYLFNGTDANNRAFLSSYDPAGASGQKPRVVGRWFPTSDDWAWDSTLHNGAPKGWYIPYSINAIGWNMAIKVQGQYAVTTNQGTATGLGYINTTFNGLTADTLRYNADTTNAGANRLYLAGGGLTSLANPSVYFGAGNIEIGNAVFYIYESGNFTRVTDIDFTGGTLLNYAIASASKQIVGVSIDHITAHDSGDTIIFGSSATGTPLLDVDVSHCDFTSLTGPGVIAYGRGVAGRVHHNTVKGGNLAAAQGASFYCVADSLSRTFDIEYNYGADIRNGTGNCSFDGAFAYADSGSTNVRIRWNRCDNSYKPFQVNNGKRCELIGNVAFNCDTLCTFTDADLKGTSDYHAVNNTYIGTPGMSQFQCGVDASTFTNAPLTFTAANGSLVGITAMNNLLVGSGVSDKAAIRVLTTALYASKASVTNNFASGYSTQVVQDWDGADHTVGSNTVISGDPAFVDLSTGDVRLKTASPLIGAGVLSALSATDMKGRAYRTTPSIGAYETDPFVSIDTLIF